MKLSFPLFAFLLAVVLVICLWPSVSGGKVFLPLDLLWQCPPHTPPDGVPVFQMQRTGRFAFDVEAKIRR